ncbi:MAG: hypothetical protein ACRDYX_19890 [Egibacteraceae bacterium]
MLAAVGSAANEELTWLQEKAGLDDPSLREIRGQRRPCGDE